MLRYRDLPIQRKLMIIIVGVSSAVLLAALIVFAAYGVWTNWQHNLDDMTTLAKVTALNAAAALMFDDPRAATETLAALSANPTVLAVYVLTDDQKVFVQYRTQGWQTLDAADRSRSIDELIEQAASESLWRLKSDLIVTVPITLDEHRIGRVLIQSDVRGLVKSIYSSLFIALAVSAIIFLLVFKASSRLQGLISAPILQLVGAMRNIADGAVADMRMEKRSNDEIGTLYDGFNAMLHTIQHRTRELRDSEERFRALVESTNDWIWEIDEQARYTYASPRVRDLLGYEPQEVMGRTPFALMPPEEAIRTAAELESKLRSRDMFVNLEKVNVHKDGRPVVLETSGVPIFDAAGQFKGYRGIDRDITSRKLAEQKISVLMKEQQAILETSAVGVSFVKDRKQLWSNPAFRTLFGYSQDESVGLDARRLYADARDFDRVGLEGYGRLAQGESYSTEVRGLRKDGSAFWVQLTGRAVNPHDLGEGAIWVFQDITDRKRAEDALRESEEKYRLLVEAANSVILAWDTAGRVLYLNEYGERFFGFSKSELVGRSVIGTIVPERESSGRDLKQLMEEIERDPDGYRDNENENMTRDGRRVWVRWANKAITDEKGSLTGILSIGNDITERRQAEAALREKTLLLETLNRTLEQRVEEEVAIRTRGEQVLIQQSKLAAMGEMLGAIAHQWRQPLNTLALIVQNLRDAQAYGELNREYLEQAVQKAMAQIQHMSSTIEDFRNFFRPDRERTAFDAMRAVGEVLSLFSGQLSSSNISYRLTCHTHGRTFQDHAHIMLCPAKTVEGYHNEFEHVILNLIENGRHAIQEKREQDPQFRSEPGLLTFDFMQEGGKVIVEVGDNGGGIRNEVIDRVFEPYFTTKDPARGTGLGLYMSKVIIEDHMQGKLTARNSGPGAVFRIELPQADGGASHD